MARARMLSPKVRELTLRSSAPLAFIPGQWVNLVLGEGVVRSYSIASAPRADASFDLAVTRVDGGPGSNRLHAVAPGETIEIARPQGFFTLPATPASLLLVATGTGVAPFRAMLQALDDTPSPPRVTLLFGVRAPEDLLYRDEFDARSRSGWFRFEPTLSRPPPEWSGRRGYVQTHLGELLAAQPDADTWICGLSPMVNAARATLREELGLPRQRVHSERYD